jgi:hypothetical protein
MQATNDNAPEVVVENLDKSEDRWRLATIGVLALAGFLCLCFSGVLLANFMQSGTSQARTVPTAIRRATFAETWTPTPTDTASPTAPAPPTATGTDTPTATPTPTDTPQFTATSTPRPPTNTPRPRPTSTRRPTATKTPVPPPASFPLRVSQVRTFANCCSVGVFGTVKSGNSLISGVNIRLIPHGASTAYQTTTDGFIGSGGDRNYEMSTHNGIGAGNYTLVVVDAFGNAISPGTSVVLCGPGSSTCPQWMEVDLMQN